MESVSRGEAAPVSPFARDFRIKLEQAHSEGDVARIEEKVDMVLEGIFQMPNLAAPLYMEIASSPVDDIRHLAVHGIRGAFKCDQQIGGEAWQKLLNDKDPHIAHAALHEFFDYVQAIELGLEHDRDLRPIYGGSED